MSVIVCGFSLFRRVSFVYRTIFCPINQHCLTDVPTHPGVTCYREKIFPIARRSYSHAETRLNNVDLCNKKLLQATDDRFTKEETLACGKKLPEARLLSLCGAGRLRGIL